MSGAEPRPITDFNAFQASQNASRWGVSNISECMCEAYVCWVQGDADSAPSKYASDCRRKLAARARECVRIGLLHWSICHCHFHQEYKYIRKWDSVRRPHLTCRSDLASGTSEVFRGLPWWPGRKGRPATPHSPDHPFASMLEPCKIRSQFIDQIYLVCNSWSFQGRMENSCCTMPSLPPVRTLILLACSDRLYSKNGKCIIN